MHDDVWEDSLASGTVEIVRRHLAVKLLGTSIIQSHSAMAPGPCLAWPGLAYFNAMLLPDAAVKLQGDNYRPRQTLDILYVPVAYVLT